jgi:hypothetical protein
VRSRKEISLSWLRKAVIGQKIENSCFDVSTTKLQNCFSTQLVPYRRVIKTSFRNIAFRQLCTVCLERWQFNSSSRIIVVHWNHYAFPIATRLRFNYIANKTKRLSTHSTGLNLFSKQTYVLIVGLLLFTEILASESAVINSLNFQALRTTAISDCPPAIDSVKIYIFYHSASDLQFVGWWVLISTVKKADSFRLWKKRKKTVPNER